MTVEQVVALIKSVTELFGVLVWPAVAVFVLIRFGKPLREFFGSLGELSFKAAGIEASAKRSQAEVAAALGAAVATSKAAASESPTQSAARARDIADVVAERVTARTLRQAQGVRILWVDDRPSNNVLERRSLEAVGIDVAISTSTEDAVQRLTAESFAALITDMSRPPDSEAGYRLLEEVRRLGRRIPLIIYAGSASPDERAEASARGAYGRTNRADELFPLVLNAVGLDAGSARVGV